MSVWIMRNDYKIMNDVAMLVIPDSDNDLNLSKIYACEGKVMRWRRRYRLEVFIEKRRKKPKPRVDVSAFMPGALVFNQKAYDAFYTFMKPFAQFLEVDVDDKIEYLVNVKNVITCVNPELTEYRASGSISAHVIDSDKVPKEPSIFKDVITKSVHIYVNAGAKKTLDALIAEFKITGLEFIRVKMNP